MENTGKSTVVEGISRTIMSCYRLLANAKPEDGPMIKDVYAAALRGIQDDLERFNIELVLKDKEIFNFLVEFNRELVYERYDLLPVNSLYINYLSRISEITVYSCLTSLTELLTKVTPADSDMVSGILKAALAGINGYDLHDEEECMMYTYLENVHRVLLSGNIDILPCRMDGTSVISLSQESSEPSTNEVTWRDLYRIILQFNELVLPSSKDYEIKIEGLSIKVEHMRLPVLYMDFDCILSDDRKSYEPLQLRVFPFRFGSRTPSHSDMISIDVEEDIKSSTSKLIELLDREATVLIDDLVNLVKNTIKKDKGKGV